jgi:hypothetical protein
MCGDIVAFLSPEIDQGEDLNGEMNLEDRALRLQDRWRQRGTGGDRGRLQRLAAGAETAEGD